MFTMTWLSHLVSNSIDTNLYWERSLELILTCKLYIQHDLNKGHRKPDNNDCFAEI